jgi:hypothetical protein
LSKIVPVVDFDTCYNYISTYYVPISYKIRSLARLQLNSEAVLIELCRLYGNLCYNNDTGRAQVREQGILQKIQTALQAGLDVASDSRLLAVLPAFLQNFCISNPGNVSSAAELMPDLVELLKKCANLEQLGSFSELLVTLDELEGGRQALLETDAVYTFIVHLINVTEVENFDQLDPDFRHLLSELIEDEKAAEKFIAHSLHLVLLDKIQKSVDGGNPSYGEDGWMKWACDLFTLLLSHAESDPVRALLPKIASWLTSSCGYAVAAAALILGNYCTSEATCQQLLGDCPNVLNDLTTRLRAGEERFVLHAVVGCLRNLAVCQPVRPQLLAAQVDSHALQLIIDLDASTNDITVEYKLVGLLRLLAQQNTALCGRLSVQPQAWDKFISLAAHDSLSNGHMAIEIGRLFSCLIRHGNSAEVWTAFLTSDGLPYLTALLASPHLQLQNEALVPLAMLSAQRPPVEPLVVKLNVDQLVGRLSELMIASATPEEVRWNAAQVVGNLLAWNLTGVTDKLILHQDLLRQGLAILERDLVPADRKTTIAEIVNKLNQALA